LNVAREKRRIACGRTCQGAALGGIHALRSSLHSFRVEDLDYCRCTPKPSTAPNFQRVSRLRQGALIPAFYHALARRTGDAGGLADENQGLDLPAMAARLSYSGRQVQWVGEEPRTAAGKVASLLSFPSDPLAKS